MSQFDPWMDATAQAQLIQSGEMTAPELLEATIAHVAAVDAHINALVIPLFEKARAQASTLADGPFAGAPYVLQDLTLLSAGDLDTSGIKGVKAAGRRADHDSYFVQLMRRAGFVLLGRASTLEIGTQAAIEPEAWRPCRNPWDLERSVGGSSGGSAAAVAAGVAPIAHGNDTAGCVRAPAAICGVVGLKPTRGRISSGPTVAHSDNVSGLGHEGLLARSVRDIAACLDLVSGHQPGDAYCAPVPTRPFRLEVGAPSGRLRIGVLAHDPAGDFQVDRQIVAVVDETAEVLQGLGHIVADAFPRALNDRRHLEWLSTISDVVVAREIARYGRLIGRELTEQDLEAPTWRRIERSRSISGSRYAECVDHLRAFAGKLENWWLHDGWDVLLTPTCGRQPARLGEVRPITPDPFIDDLLPILGFTSPYNVSGQPAISLPLGETPAGLPVGIQLVAAYGREDILFRLSRQLEEVLPWADRRPGLLAS